MSGFVYAIESGDAVKIGFAADPVRRLSELNVGAPGTHRLLGFARGTKAHERSIHEICRAERVRGEWFRKAGHVLLFLDHLPKYRPRKPSPMPREVVQRTRCLRLTNYLAKSGLTYESFAEEIGVTPNAVRKWAEGERFPRPLLMLKIIKATNGEVCPNDFLPARSTNGP